MTLLKQKMDERTKKLAQQLALVQNEIDDAVVSSGRKPGDVRLVAVSKLHSAEDITRFNYLGHSIFGESYVQEAVNKQQSLPKNIEWHFIGGLQSNKAKQVAGAFSLIHSVDSPKLARLLHSFAQAKGIVQDILIQVSLAGETQKYGIEEKILPYLLEEAQNLAGIRVVGFMTMPPFFDNAEASRPYFCRLRKLRDTMEQSFGKVFFELSMGMTNDFIPAIEEGATLVRIGTKLFGARLCKKQ